jgi:hypothetical protein
MRRLLRVARAGYGITLLAAPGRVVRAFGGDPSDATVTVMARVLGARHLLQALVIGKDPGAFRRYGAAFVDVMHAASMFGVAKVDPLRHKPALVDGSIAAGFALADVAVR